MIKRYFEWIAGDDIGKVVILESIEDVDGEHIYNFDDGESCNERFISPITDVSSELKERVMVEVENPSNVWTVEEIKPKIYKDVSMEGETYEIPTLHDIVNAGGEGSTVMSDVGTTKLVPPARKQRTKPLPKIEDYSAPVAPMGPVQVSVAEPVSPVSGVDVKESVETEAPHGPVSPAIGGKRSPSFDPVVILVERCKKHPTKVSLELTIDLPAKSMYAIAESEFENGGDSFIDHVVEEIDTKIIVERLKEALRVAYGAKSEN